MAAEGTHKRSRSEKESQIHFDGYGRFIQLLQNLLGACWKRLPQRVEKGKGLLTFEGPDRLAKKPESGLDPYIAAITHSQIELLNERKQRSQKGT